MAGSTPIYGFPYPQSTDLVADYPTLGQELATDVETVISNLGAGLDHIVGGSLSGASTNFTSCFSATYNCYRIVFYGTPASSSYPNWRLLSGTTPATGSNYVHVSLTGAGGGANSYTATNTAAFTDGYGSASEHFCVMDINFPFLSRYTFTTSIGRSQAPGIDVLSYVHTVASSYNGIQFYPNSGNWTGGGVDIYGYSL